MILQGVYSPSRSSPVGVQFAAFGEAPQRITRGGPGAGDAAAAVTRIPAGHPEGYLEGFATLYKEIAEEIRANRNGDSTDAPFPRGEDGASGVRFVEKTVESSKAGAIWVDV